MSKPHIPDVAARFSAYQALHPCWGSLHIVLEDFNVEDRHVRWCADFALSIGDTEGEALAQILMLMSKSQRGRLPRVLHLHA